MNEKTKAVLLNRVYILNRDIGWNKAHFERLEGEVEASKNIVSDLEAERVQLLEDLKDAGVDVDASV